MAGGWSNTHSVGRGKKAVWIRGRKGETKRTAVKRHRNAGYDI